MRDLLRAVACVMATGFLLSVSCGDTDAQTETDTDTDTDVDVEPCEAEGTWFDTSSDLCWEAEPADGRISPVDGATYCGGLTLGGHAWVMPDVDQLRTLIRGCPVNETGGACGVTSSCLDYPDCRSACEVCDHLGGPGPEGCYWPAELAGACAGAYWSSDVATNAPDQQWQVSFDYGGDPTCRPHAEWTNLVRCVRKDD